MSQVPLPTTGYSSVPVHIAIIMDGNGRWARSHGKARIYGHRQGAEAVRKIVTSARELGVRYLTLYSFSSENWNRPATEISELMGLLRLYLEKEIKLMIEQSISFRVIGDRSRLPTDIVRAIEKAEEKTKGGTKLTLCLALSYGGRHEIVEATRKVAFQIADGSLSPADITSDKFSECLFTYGIPDPDLLIRTSGEKRISNFLLWQLAYTELVFLDKYWPDFDEGDLIAAIEEFGTRERRYGRST